MVQRLNLRAFLFLSLIFSLSLSPASWSKTKKLSVAQVAAQQATQESNSQSLTLEMFLDQVREGNKDFEAATKASQGAKLRANEASFVTGFRSLGEASYGEDKMEPNSQLSLTIFAPQNLVWEFKNNFLLVSELS